MRTVPVTSFMAITIFSLIIAPVSATYVLSNLTLAPGGPLVPGAQQEVIARYALLPSGSTTFVPGHNLQMLTALTDASWDLQVIVDGRNAARQTGAGKAVFVNGEILSYPTDRDVSIEVTVRGLVPRNTSGPLTVLQVGEVDNTGGIVPGSASTLNEPLAGMTPAPAPTSALTTISIPVSVPTPSPSPTKSQGFVTSASIAALGMVLVLLLRHRA